MNPSTIEGLMTIGVALLLIGASIPLILRKVPMNGLYGFRTPRAFKSEKDWYEINASGGKVLCGASLPNLLLGLFQLFAPAAWKSPWITLGVPFIPVIVCVVFALRGARKIDEKNSAPGKREE